MAKLTKEQSLEDLKRKKHSCTLDEVETALRAWKFTEGRTKGHARVWNYKHVTLTLHVPHGRSGKAMDPGAVATAIRKIEEAALMQEQEDEVKHDAD
jgi:hypothetical protein